MANPLSFSAAHWVDHLDDALALVEAAHQDFLRRNEVILPPVVEEKEAKE